MKMYVIQKEELETIVSEAVSDFFNRPMGVKDSEVREELSTFTGYPVNESYVVDDDLLRDIMRSAMSYTGVPDEKFESEYIEYVDTLDKW